MAGMFANTDWRSAIMAALAGYMSRQNPQVSAGLFNALDAKQRRKEDEAQYQRKRQDDFADWKAQYDYQTEHPKPAQPGEFEQRLQASGVQPGSPEWINAMKAAVQNTTDPVIMTPQGPMTRSQLLGGSMAPPGVTFTPIGGPTPQASGGFPF